MKHNLPEAAKKEKMINNNKPKATSETTDTRTMNCQRETDIMKTRLFKYIENFTTKKGKLSDK